MDNVLLEERGKGADQKNEGATDQNQIASSFPLLQSNFTADQKENAKAEKFEKSFPK